MQCSTCGTLLIFISIAELPDAPEKPTIDDVTANSMVVSWEAPNDNGSEIQGYWLEKREINSTRWTRVNRNLIPDLEMDVQGLIEGLTYLFRVAAENVAGPGKFSPPSEPRTAQRPISKSMFALAEIDLKANKLLELFKMCSGLASDVCFSLQCHLDHQL